MTIMKTIIKIIKVDRKRTLNTSNDSCTPLQALHSPTTADAEDCKYCTEYVTLVH